MPAGLVLVTEWMVRSKPCVCVHVLLKLGGGEEGGNHACVIGLLWLYIHGISKSTCIYYV